MTEADETVTVDGKDGSLRLDRWFKRHYPGLGHGRLEKLLRTGRIRVDGKPARPAARPPRGAGSGAPAPAAGRGGTPRSTAVASTAPGGRSHAAGRDPPPRRS